MVIELISKRECFALLVHTSLATEDLVHILVGDHFTPLDLLNGSIQTACDSLVGEHLCEGLGR